MKYALISEDQITSIEYALNDQDRHEVLQALAIIYSLKPQEPVAYGLETDSGDVIDCITPAIYHDDNGEYSIPLFALEQT